MTEKQLKKMLVKLGVLPSEKLKPKTLKLTEEELNTKLEEFYKKGFADGEKYESERYAKTQEDVKWVNGRKIHPPSGIEITHKRPSISYRSGSSDFNPMG